MKPIFSKPPPIRKIRYCLTMCCIATIGWAQNMTDSLSVWNEASINTKTLEYSPIFYQDKLVFTSTRPTAGSPMTKWRDETKQFADLYIAEKSEYGGFFNAKRLPGKASSPKHDGVATFNQAGTEMFFTRSNLNGKNAKNIITLKIYSAQLINNVWQNIQELPLNDEEFSNCHPALSKDETKLYFASNRAGGYGGMDLYVSQKKNGVWQRPRNLGPNINSPANESFPFVAASGTLYFASNNEQSFGGMDLYKAKKEKGPNEFESAQNLGLAYNSEYDDFGFCTNESELEGYFSSNRPDGKGGDDIYHWKITQVALPPDQISLSVYDERSSEAVAQATITIFEGEVASTKNDIYPIAKMVSMTTMQADNPYRNLAKKTFQTGTRGVVNMVHKKEKSYTIFVEKEGYIPLKKVINARAIQEQKQWGFPLDRIAGIPLNITAIGMPYRKPVPYVSLELINQTTQESKRVISDEFGNFSFFLACDCEYELISTKEYYRNYQKKFSTKHRVCGNLDAIDAKLYLVEQEVIENISVSRQIRFPSFASFEAQHIQRVGTIIVLNRLTFPENKATLLPHATKELEKVYAYLQRSPKIKVEISVHTDARGTAKFNHRLSQKRADIIAQYLLDRGIPKQQFSTIGYGEDRLLNHCQDRVACSESEHLENKRIEMKIIQDGKLNGNNLVGKR